MLKKKKRTFSSAAVDLIGPDADTGRIVVGQTGGALVATGFSVPAAPEHVTSILIGEDAVQTLAMRCANRWL